LKNYNAKKTKCSQELIHHKIFVSLITNHLSVSDNLSSLNFNMHECIFSNLSILLRLLGVSMPHTENSLSSKACKEGADTKSCAVSGRTEYTFDSSFWLKNLKAVALLSNAPVALCILVQLGD